MVAVKVSDWEKYLFTFPIYNDTFESDSMTSNQTDIKYNGAEK